MKRLTCNISAVGCWGHGFTNWPELSDLLATKMESGSDTPIKKNELIFLSPKLEIIPPNERRRAPLPVKLAVESSWQATQSADIDPKHLACVFVSGLGDTQLTDYMCKVLATELKQLSPTKFHNSVHNAAAGYWTISTGCMKAANSVAGFKNSVSLALLEAVIQCVHENTPILITFYDVPIAQIQQPLFPNANEHPLSVSLIIEPLQDNSISPTLELAVINETTVWPTLNVGILQNDYEKNPTAKIFALLKMLAEAKTNTIRLPLSTGTSVQLSITY
jgi:hypothetical protein